jgi:hypothetical protein
VEYVDLPLHLYWQNYVPHPPNIGIFELRSDPVTIDGAINLTPNALQYLDHHQAERLER